jgi:serine/threonine-protein kinase ATR
VPFGPTVKAIMRENAHCMSSNDAYKHWKDSASDEEKLRLLREVYYPRHPLAMAEWLRRSFPDASMWFNARTSFTRTAAVMSMVGFVVGLGDRHGENILIDSKTGEVFHVDFNILFDKGESLGVPEIVPFRLTRNVIDGFGPTGIEGTFRKACETAMAVMRNEQEMIATVLETFVHDPLLEWTRVESRNQQSRQRGEVSKTSDLAKQEAHDTIELIRRRLSGNIVTAKIYRSELNAPPMSVEGQVAKLIQLASDDMKLAKMYIGWASYV